MVYTVTINPALDYVMRFSSLEGHDVHRAEETRLLFGGKGINVSNMLSTLGVSNKALGFAAGFTGRALIKELDEASNVNADFVFLPEGLTRINVKVFGEQQLDLNAAGPNISDAAMEQLLEKLDGISSGDTVVLAGNAPTHLYERMLNRLKGKDIRVVIDAPGDCVKDLLSYRPFLIKPNHHELGELFGVDIDPTNDDAIAMYAGLVQARGAENVLVSRGKHGATLFAADGKSYDSATVPGRAVNNVGCGDAMLAGFLAGYLQTGHYDEALRLGSAAGNASAFCDGLATKPEVEAMLGQL